MAAAIDLIIALIFIFAVIYGIIKGFIGSVSWIFSLLAAFAAALLLTPVLSALLYDGFMLDRVSAAVETAAVGLFSGDTGLAKLFEEKPDVFMDLLSRFGADAAALEEYYGALDGLGTETAKILVRDAIADPIAEMLSNAVSYLIIFLLVMLITKLIFKQLNRAVNATPLGVVNRILGACFGVLWSYLLIAVRGDTLKAWPAFCAMQPDIFYPGQLESSYITQFCSITIFIPARRISPQLYNIS